MKNKKSESILVPLISAYDARRIYDPIPLKTSVGKMTVTRDDAFPKTIRFENIVAFGDEATIESKVYERFSWAIPHPPVLSLALNMIRII